MHIRTIMTEKKRENSKETYKLKRDNKVTKAVKRKQEK